MRLLRGSWGRMAIERINLIFLGKFDELSKQEELKYCIIGGLAVGIWGELRFTADIDYVIRRKDFELLKIIMSKLGYKLVFAHPKLSFSHFIPDSGIGVKVDFMMVEDDTWNHLTESGQLADFGDNNMFPVVGAIHLISMKLHSASQPDRETPMKDLLDIVSISKSQGITFEELESRGIIAKYGNQVSITRLRDLFSDSSRKS